MKLNISESQNIEFKQSWRDEYIKWLSAFGNTDGGKLYIGVDDDGKIKGIDNAKKLLEDIPNKARDILGIMVDVNLLQDEDKEYIEIITDKYPYPISYKGSYYYRSGSTTQELKGVALDKFLLGKQGKTWDSVPVPYFGDRDLDPYFNTDKSSPNGLGEKLGETQQNIIKLMQNNPKIAITALATELETFKTISPT